jgi:hypothetical protein
MTTVVSQDLTAGGERPGALEDHAVRHSYHHLAGIRRALKGARS